MSSEVSVLKVAVRVSSKTMGNIFYYKPQHIALPVHYIHIHDIFTSRECVSGPFVSCIFIYLRHVDQWLLSVDGVGKAVNSIISKHSRGRQGSECFHA